MKPLVTVIIISYRNLAGIYTSLLSVLDQTYEKIEIIFSDDGSPGFSEEAKKIKSYITFHQKGNISNVIYNIIPENIGTVKNINSAIVLGNGRYIKILSAEDKLSHPDVLSHYVDFMETHKSKIVFAKMRGVMLDGQYKYKLLSCESNYNRLRNYTVEQTRNRLFRRNFLPAPAWMIDAEIFHIYGLFLESTRLIEDYPYWLYLSSRGVKFDYIDEIMIDYRLSGVSSAGKFSKTFMNDMMVIYDNYIFPYDKRFGILQPFYNMLKRTGLNFYIAEAERDEISHIQKFIVRVKYFPFWIFVSVQNMFNGMINKCLNIHKKKED